MYSIEWSRLLVRAPRERLTTDDGASDTLDHVAETDGRRRRFPRIHPTVWALGTTSLLTDISSEMVASILPVYLVLYLGMSPLMFGLVDGLYQGAAALVRVVAGVLADRWSRYKEIAAFGYGLSALSRMLLPAAGNAWGAIAAAIAVDRAGKGIRTAPRDALISKSSSPAELSTAFGVHRALDATGAMLGPVVAFFVLALTPNGYDILFVASFAVAILGLGVVVLFVPSERSIQQQVNGKSTNFGALFGLLAEPAFRAQTVAGALLGLFTISDSFIFLSLQKRMEFPVTAFPLLYVGASLSTAFFATPIGRLADSFGRTKVLIGGYSVLATVYALLLIPTSHGLALPILSIVMIGVYYAGTDGVLTAMAASVLPRERVGGGLALLATAINLTRMVSSLLFGLLWTRVGQTGATVAFLFALIGATIAVAYLLNSSKKHAYNVTGHKRD